jgi:hypothetical protein
MEMVSNVDITVRVLNIEGRWFRFKLKIGLSMVDDFYHLNVTIFIIKTNYNPNTQNLCGPL